MESILTFLRQLAKNNNREWYAAHKDLFLVARDELTSAAEQLIAGISSFDSDIAALKAKDTIYKMHRDTRFTKDKTPYKLNMGSYLAKGGRKSVYAGYYLHIQPEASFLAAGLWEPEMPALNAVRQEIFYNSKGLIKILNNNKFKNKFKALEEHSLKKAPRGYENSHPAIGLIKHTSFIASRTFTDDEVMAPDFIGRCIEDFRDLFPLVQFLNNSISLMEDSSI